MMCNRPWFFFECNCFVFVSGAPSSFERCLFECCYHIIICVSFSIITFVFKIVHVQSLMSRSSDSSCCIMIKCMWCVTAYKYVIGELKMTEVVFGYSTLVIQVSLRNNCYAFECGHKQLLQLVYEVGVVFLLQVYHCLVRLKSNRVMSNKIYLWRFSQVSIADFYRETKY